MEEPRAAPIGFAHRGARTEEPENTLAAFRRALVQGATGLETDARLTSDGEVVLVHDAAVRKGLRWFRVAGTPAARLAALEVPRLGELYAELGTGFELSIDVKTRAAADRILDLARAAGALSRLWLCHPDPVFLLNVRARSDEVRLVHSRRKERIGAPLERHAHDLASSGIDALNLHHRDWTKGLVALFQRFGVRAFAWDAQEVRHLRAMLAMGVDGVYCDRVERMMATIGGWVAYGPGSAPHTGTSEGA